MAVSVSFSPNWVKPTIWFCTLNILKSYGIPKNKLEEWGIKSKVNPQGCVYKWYVDIVEKLAYILKVLTLLF